MVSQGLGPEIGGCHRKSWRNVFKEDGAGTLVMVLYLLFLGNKSIKIPLTICTLIGLFVLVTKMALFIGNQ